jgi:hypothetical protein
MQMAKTALQRLTEAYRLISFKIFPTESKTTFSTLFSSSKLNFLSFKKSYTILRLQANSICSGVYPSKHIEG